MPRKPEIPTALLSFRLPRTMRDQVDAQAGKNGLRRAEWLARIVTRALQKLPPS